MRLLTLVCLCLVATAALVLPADGETLGRGRQWVRSHPFTVMAMCEWPPDVHAYKAVGFTAAFVIQSRHRRAELDAILPPFSRAGMPWHWMWYGPLDANHLASHVAAWRQRYPLNGGWYLGDELGDLDAEAKASLAGASAAARRLAPDALVYANARGMDFPGVGENVGVYKAYLDRYLRDVQPDLLMFTCYPFYRGGTAGNFFENLGAVREKALDAGLPYWIWAQSHGMSPAGPFQEPSESEMRFQAFTALAYGFTGIAYWTYASAYPPYTNAMLDANGQQTHMYRSASRLVPEVVRPGETLRSLTSTGVYYCPAPSAPAPAGTIPWQPSPGSPIRRVDAAPGSQGAVLGLFRDDQGAEYFMLVNCEHAAGQDAASTARPVSIRFSPAVTALELVDRQTGRRRPIAIANHRLEGWVLPGGTGDLFRLHMRQDAARAIP